MRHRRLLLILVPLAAGACAQVLGLDEPTVKDEAAGGASSSGSLAQTGSTGGATASSTSATGRGGAGPGGGPGAGGAGGDGGCDGHADCDDRNPCTIDVCSDGACVNEASGSDPADDADDCVDVTCAGEVPTFTPDDTEDAADPNPPCHTAVCGGGLPVDVFAPDGTVCGDPPLVCDGEGSCAGCSVDADCGAAGPCADPQCGLDGICDPGLFAQGTVVDDPAGNCKSAVCTGQSAVPNQQADLDDVPPPMTCAEVSCTQAGPRIEDANDGTPCTVGDFEGICRGNAVGDDACVQCRNENDCTDEAGGERCFEQSGICGCSFSGDCQGYWRGGEACVFDATLNESVCGCEADAGCDSNMHGHVCVGQRCGCLDAGDCVGARLGATCLAALDRCGCVSDADCTTSLRGTACLPDDGCGCLSNADCPQGTTCALQYNICQ